LYKNSKSLTHEPLSRRREILRETFREVEGEFVFASFMNTNQIDDIQTFLSEAVTNQCEGLMIKDLKSKYTPGSRSYAWLKVKKDYMSGMTDSLDLVPVGAFLGRGKRTGLYGAFLLACYDDENEEYQTICKIGTGFSDAALEQHSSFLKQYLIPEPRPYYRYGDSGAAVPDVWFDAAQVWEVLAADLSISPLYQAGVGLVDPAKGVSLRFPRFIRIREDKSPELATNSLQVAEMFRKQALSSNNNSKPNNIEEDEEYI